MDRGKRKSISDEGIGGELTEEITQAEVLASNPFLVIDTRLMEVIVPSQGVTHCVVLVSFYTSWKRDKYKKEKKKRRAWSQHSLFHSQFFWEFEQSRAEQSTQPETPDLEYWDAALPAFLYITPCFCLELPKCSLSQLLSRFI